MEYKIGDIIRSYGFTKIQLEALLKSAFTVLKLSPDEVVKWLDEAKKISNE